jgi:SOS response regulatory protein OraA/RecX
MAGSGLAGAIGGSGETFDQFVERFDEHDFADEKAFADTTIELAKLFGKEYTPLEEERLRSGIVNDKTRVEVVLSMQSDVKEMVTAWVRGEEVNRSVGQGSMSTNER